MEISKELAQSIVVEMKKIIDKDLNFIDSNGIIIASTDETRIGTYHAGGKQVILRKDIIKINRDEEYIGSRKGINLPLNFNGELIGVIGISGETNEVEKYGQIIKRMSEILIKEAWILKRNEEESEKERIFLETLLFQNSFLYNPIIFSETLEEIEKKKNGVIIVGKIIKIYDLESIKKIYDPIRIKVKKYNGYSMLNQNTIIILDFHKDREKIIELLSEFNKKEFLSFGVGKIKEKIGELKDSYKEGVEALEWGIKSKNEITFYDDLDLELIIKNITKNLAQIYKEKIFKKLTNKEIEEYNIIFLLYEKYNGSLNKIAKELFIHVNTLQYKLNKLYEKTDLNMRNYNDFTKLKIAFMLKVE